MSMFPAVWDKGELKLLFSAYLLYCIMTGIATHMTRTVLAEHRVNEMIAEQFKV